MPDRTWIDEPDVVAPPFLRWRLFRGVEPNGSIRWFLQAQEDGYKSVLLAVPDFPSAEELMEALKPIVGRRIAESLADEAIDRLPEDRFAFGR